MPVPYRLLIQLGFHIGQEIIIHGILISGAPWSLLSANKNIPSAKCPCEFFPTQWQVPPIFHWHATNEWLNESKFHWAKQWKETPTAQRLKTQTSCINERRWLWVLYSVKKTAPLFVREHYLFARARNVSSQLELVLKRLWISQYLCNTGNLVNIKEYPEK